MADSRDIFLQWLRDAHAMEEQAEQMLASTAGRLESYGDLKLRLLQHQSETREHARLVDACLRRHGTASSTIKDMTARATAFAQGLSGLFVADEVIKATLASTTFEHMEIASYAIIIAAAEALGDAETVSICRRILEDEQQMARWLEENTPAVVQRFLATGAGT
ncbi:ferritin-like domain-containing protein [Roseomonas sp. JC162]|uniref:Ferritin-like domain-containing protein n=1 Tax=Neoroseomonas marina TaxID=1232220 RepID=A0A848EFQ3_9PROT|nr:DUF892 family protein [Neoroseomonas marina]NMJ42826.1 ferritin-like domain-containing protein [Neoroseomonas marina]